MPKSLEAHPTGLWTFLTTAILLCVGGFILGGFSIIKNEIPFMVGNIHSINNSGNIMGVILSAAFLSAVLSLVGSLWINVGLYKTTGLNAVVDYLDKMKNKYNFFVFFMLVLIEEVAVRWFLIGVLPKFLQPNDFVFYSLVFGGNLAWALIHLFNFEESKDRNPIRVLPQFISGLLFTFVFLKYGLLASVLTHFMSNCLLLSLHKIENPFSDKDIWIGVYSLFISAIGSAFLYVRGFSIWSLMQWFDFNDQFALENWNVLDYFAGTLVIIYFLKMLGVFLGYDCGVVKDDGKPEELPKLWEVCVGALLFIVLAFGGYYLLGVFTPNIQFKAIIITIIICFFYKSSSGSGVARNLLIIFPSIYISICTLDVIGIWLFFIFLFGHGLIRIPLLFLERRNVQEKRDV